VGKYTCFDALIGWYFCLKCGVAPFAITGEFEVVEQEVDIPTPGPVDGEYKVTKEKRKVWKIKGGKGDTKRVYLSVNAVTIDQIQPGGFDLRELADRGIIEYLDWLSDSTQKDAKPYPGGLY
jgi:hypothetical protein